MTDTESRLVGIDGGRLIVCREYVWNLHRNRLDTFENFYDESLVGKPVRDVGPRANLRVVMDAGGAGKVTLFLKRHRPTGFFEKLCSRLRGRLARTPARVEWDNLRRVSELGIRTASPVVLGEDAATGRSFVATAEIEQALPADDFARARLASSDRPVARARRDFARKFGGLVRKLHAAGLTHRDLYLCHVFVQLVLRSEGAPCSAKPATQGEEKSPLRRVEPVGDDCELYLIDLQRVAPALLRRWKVKDVAQLEFSRPPGTFTRTDGARFLQAYFATEHLGRREKRFAAAVLRKAESIRRRERSLVLRSEGAPCSAKPASQGEEESPLRRVEKDAKS